MKTTLFSIALFACAAGCFSFALDIDFPKTTGVIAGCVMCCTAVRRLNG